MKHQGKILNWNDEKGFGFVETNDGRERAFVHIKAFKPRSRRPVNGDLISYELVRENNKRFRAKNIAFLRDMNESPHKSKTKKSRSFGTTFTLFFCAGLSASVALGNLPVSIAGLYSVLSTITFIAYAIDKSAARNNRWRTQESTLHLLSLVGGWPGAYFGQTKLHHKSRKTEFKRVYWITVVLNLAGLFWLHTEKGANFLNSLISAL